MPIKVSNYDNKNDLINLTPGTGISINNNTGVVSNTGVVTVQTNHAGRLYVNGQDINLFDDANGTTVFYGNTTVRKNLGVNGSITGLNSTVKIDGVLDVNKDIVAGDGHIQVICIGTDGKAKSKAKIKSDAPATLTLMPHVTTGADGSETPSVNPSNYASITLGGSSPGGDHAALYPTYIAQGTFNGMALGSPDHRWAAIYSTTAVSVASDRNLKDEIWPLNAKYLDLLLKLTPRSYIIKSDVTSGTHVGFIAQEVEEAAIEAGLDPDSLGFINKVKIDGNYIYALQYEEFIAIITKSVQDLHDRVTALEERVLGRQ